MVAFGVGGMLWGAAAMGFLLSGFYYRAVKRSLERTKKLAEEQAAFHSEMQDAFATMANLEVPDWAKAYLEAGFTVEYRRGAWLLSKAAPIVRSVRPPFSIDPEDAP
jgi:hypothetical protein